MSMQTLKNKQEQAIQNKSSQVRQNKSTSFASPPCEFTGDLISQMKNATSPPCEFTGDLVGQMKAAQEENKTSNGLPMEIQTKMENSFGQDFSDVNIHKESNSATDAGALAYTQGNDVHFAPGQFKPDTTSGQELIGHELAHVVQQREARVKPTKMLGKGMAVNDDPALEKEADDMGRKAAQGEYLYDDKQSKVHSIQNKLVVQRSEDPCMIEYNLCIENCKKFIPDGDKKGRALCYSECSEELGKCVKEPQPEFSPEPDSIPWWLLALGGAGAVGLAALDGPLPIGDAAAASLLVSLGIIAE